MTEMAYTYRPDPPRPDDWRDRAACVEIGHEPFYPEGEPSVQTQQSRWALEVCHRCPVEAECLEDALARDERYGIWGGRTPTQRELLRRERRSA